MKQPFLLLSLILLLFACSPPEEKKNLQLEEQSFSKDSISISIFNIDSGWGYDISVNNKPYIRQPHIPAVSGTQYFNSKEDAQKTASLMAKKISNHELPPTINLQELDSLQVKYNK